MSSSYVEVRESINGTGEQMLQFQLNDDCEMNGIDEMHTHIDSEPPKDHTYNKEPIIDSFLNSPSKNGRNEVEAPKKLVRAHRTIKHKIIKPRDEVAAPVNTKMESPLKSTHGKTNVAVVEPMKQIAIAEKSEESAGNKTPTEVNDVGSRSSEEELPRKRIRKRTFEEELNAFVPVEVKKKKKKKPKATPDKQVATVTESKLDIKKNFPANKSKSVKATQEKKVEKVVETKSTKKTVAESPKSAKQDTGGSTSGGLPDGWTRTIVERKSGKTAGMCDVYIYSPEGIKFRSRPDVAAFLHRTKSKLRLEDFSFKRSDTSATDDGKKTPAKTGKVVAKVEPSSQKKKTSSIVPRKKGATLKVKISTPKKSQDIKARAEKKTEKTPPSIVENLPSTSGLQSKRNRKKKVWA